MELRIERMNDTHGATLSDAFDEQGWCKPRQPYRQYSVEQASGERDVWVASVRNHVAGYVTVKWHSPYAPFYELGIPEIMDLYVLASFQCQGVASALMDHAEAAVAERADVVGIGVGLISDYGIAQALYCKRGYIPDKRGASVAGAFLTHGDKVVMGDDVVLYLTKRLSS